jgi:hypothetical protein
MACASSLVVIHFLLMADLDVTLTRTIRTLHHTDTHTAVNAHFLRHNITQDIQHQEIQDTQEILAIPEILRTQLRDIQLQATRHPVTQHLAIQHHHMVVEAVATVAAEVMAVAEVTAADIIL